MKTQHLGRIVAEQVLRIDAYKEIAEGKFLKPGVHTPGSKTLDQDHQAISRRLACSSVGISHHVFRRVKRKETVDDLDQGSTPHPLGLLTNAPVPRDDTRVTLAEKHGCGMAITIKKVEAAVVRRRP